MADLAIAAEQQLASTCLDVRLVWQDCVDIDGHIHHLISAYDIGAHIQPCIFCNLYHSSAGGLSPSCSLLAILSLPAQTMSPNIMSTSQDLDPKPSRSALPLA